jgi:hypothetical protein
MLLLLLLLLLLVLGVPAHQGGNTAAGLPNDSRHNRNRSPSCL